jgi:hypothetical protein
MKAPVCAASDILLLMLLLLHSVSASAEYVYEHLLMLTCSRLHLLQILRSMWCRVTVVKEELPFDMLMMTLLMMMTLLLLLLLNPSFPAEAEEYVVPAEQLEGGDPQEAFFRVTVLEEELRVMAPDLGAIQVRCPKHAPTCMTAALYDRCVTWAATPSCMPEGKLWFNKCKLAHAYAVLSASCTGPRIQTWEQSR